MQKLERPDEFCSSLFKLLGGTTVYQSENGTKNIQSSDRLFVDNFALEYERAKFAELYALTVFVTST